MTDNGPALMCAAAVPVLPLCVMNNSGDPQSGYVGEIEPEAIIGSRMTDIEVIRVTQSNVIAKGRRYGRWWLIKGIRMDIEGNTTLKIRLTKEFELQSRLQHPGVAHAVSIEEIDGFGMCIIMEWIEGETLADALQRNTYSAKERKRIMHEVIDAVAHIHSQGVVHRDLKPSNIMIRRSGCKAVVIDFGLADSDDYTELKYPAGTSGFISPEQMKEGGVNPSDDIYSLGVIMNALCPESRRLGLKCQLPRSKRVADAAELLKLFEHRQRRLRTAVNIGVAAGVFAMLIAAVIVIRSYIRDNLKANETIVELNEQNNRNASWIATLTDSLYAINKKFSESEDQRMSIETYLSAKSESTKNGQVIIDGALSRFERDSISVLAPGDYVTYVTRISPMVETLEDAIDSYVNSLQTDPLTTQDIESIRTELYNYFNRAVSKYLKKWNKKFYPES